MPIPDGWNYRKIIDFLDTQPSPDSYVEQLIAFGLLELSWDNENHRGEATIHWPTPDKDDQQKVAFIEGTLPWGQSGFTSEAQLTKVEGYSLENLRFIQEVAKTISQKAQSLSASPRPAM
jgi:hypothetical protein